MSQTRRCSAAAEEPVGATPPDPDEATRATADDRPIERLGDHVDLGVLHVVERLLTDGVTRATVEDDGDRSADVVTLLPRPRATGGETHPSAHTVRGPFIANEKPAPPRQR